MLAANPPSTFKNSTRLINCRPPEAASAADRRHARRQARPTKRYSLLSAITNLTNIPPTNSHEPFHNKTTTDLLTIQQQLIFLQQNNDGYSYNSTTTNIFTTKQLRIFLQLNNDESFYNKTTTNLLTTQQHELRASGLQQRCFKCRRRTPQAHAKIVRGL